MNEDFWDQLSLEIVLDRIFSDSSASVEFDKGWYQIVIDCDFELSQLDPGYTILQVKEKFGGLRYYFTPSKLATEETRAKMLMVALKYEDIASRTCEVTGQPGVLMKSPTGNYKTLNPEFAKDHEIYSKYFIVSKN